MNELEKIRAKLSLKINYTKLSSLYDVSISAVSNDDLITNDGTYFITVNRKSISINDFYIDGTDSFGVTYWDGTTLDNLQVIPYHSTLLNNYSSDNLSEGTSNLYYTDSRVQSYLDGTSINTQGYNVDGTFGYDGTIDLTSATNITVRNGIIVSVS